MKNLLQIIIFTSLILISSCSYYKHYVEKEQQLKSCHLNCLTQRGYCDKVCRNNFQECTGLVKLQAARMFKDYKKRQLVQKKVVALELQSFQDPLKCRKVTCSCQDDYRVCAQACKGKIYKHLKTKTVC